MMMKILIIWSASARVSFNASYSQIELPTDVRERSGCSLKVNKIGQGNGGNRKTNALSANMIREQFTVENDTGNIDTDTVDGEEGVKRKHADTQTGFVCSGGGVLGNHRSFED